MSGGGIGEGVCYGIVFGRRHGPALMKRRLEFVKFRSPYACVALIETVTPENRNDPRDVEGERRERIDFSVLYLLYVRRYPRAP